MVDEIRAALVSAVRDTKAPGAVLYVGNLEQTHFFEATGLRQRTPLSLRAEKDTLYDLASLTKVIVTTTLVLKLRDAGKVRLDQSIADIVPIPAFREITIHHLLTHTAGLNPGKPYYKELTTIDDMLMRYALEGIDRKPGVASVYSDVSYMLLGRMVELIERDTLDAIAVERIFDPLGMKRTRYKPPKEWAANCAATEKCEWRERVIAGEVHDENTSAVGGVAGHAGLFSTAEDLALFCRALLGGKLLKPATVDEMIALTHVPNYPWQGLGWQLDPWRGKSMGYLPSRTAFGHTGWTGTSIWLDRKTNLFSILLGNTCHPSRTSRDNAVFRRTIHDAIAKQFFPATTNAHGGLDRVMKEDFAKVSDKRIALLTNHAAVDQLGRPIRDVLAMAPDPRLHILYSPEHGLAGQAEAGATVIAQKADVRVVSLYGEQKEPTAAELEEIDWFVIDLQDIGARYYTYMATMKRCLSACARAKKPVLVLDRPNPLGGIVLEGPIATVTASDVCSAPIPVRHGMTMGELARFFLDTELKGSKLDLEISYLDSWSPEGLFSECSLPWVPPSPNIPTPETALLYVGMCLFEGTNLNEGRGTETPFAVAGAPWLDAKAVVGEIRAEDCPGCELEAVTYTPRAIAGKASDPRHKDHECQGIRIHIRNPHEVRSFRTALALLCAIHARHGDLLGWTPFFDTLAGGPDLKQRIQRGGFAATIIAAYEPALREFDEERPRFYT